jgi:acetolactate synthase I/II/III large subunit
MKVNGAQLMAHTLAEAGITTVAGIPGHTVGELAMAVGQHPELSSFLVRHESSASFAADVHYRIARRPMAIFTHAFPGAANALVGVANAYADSSALLWIVGESASAGLGRGGYQELSRQQDGDTPAMIRPVVKRLWTVREAIDLPEKTFAALQLAREGRPGPVALHVPQEVWAEEVEIPALPSAVGYLFDAAAMPPPAALERVAAALAEARRPLILAGNGVNLGGARDGLRALAERYEVPVATTVSGKGAFPEDHPLAVGVLGWVGTGLANAASREADLILCLGARLAEATNGSRQDGVTFDFGHTRLIQVDVEPASIANAYPVDQAVVGDLRLVLPALVEARGERPGVDRAEWYDRLNSARLEWEGVARASQDGGAKGAIGTGAVVQALRRAFDTPINLVCDCGKHHKWVAQQFEAREGDQVISSMGGASMGIGPGGALGAALARPDVPTVSWNGDGGMSMGLAAWPTVAEFQLPILFVVIDDAAYGVIVNGQQARFERTAFAEWNADGANPDYRLDLAAVARACGIPALSVDDPADLDEAFRWGISIDGPAVLNVLTARSSVHPDGGGKLAPAPWTIRPTAWARGSAG